MSGSAMSGHPLNILIPGIVEFPSNTYIPVAVLNIYRFMGRGFDSAVAGVKLSVYFPGSAFLL